jgi:hypothetical protein
LETQEGLIKKPGRGGYRPGGGRPKGSKSNAPRPTNVVKVRLEPVAYDAKDVRPLALRARDYTGLSLKAYVDVLKKPDASDADKIKAATEILNRGYGRSAEIINITTTNVFAGLSDGDIVTAIRALRSAPVDGGSVGTCVDVTPGEAVADGVGGTSGLQASTASPADVVEADADREQRD